MRLSQANLGEPRIRVIFVDAKGLADKNRDQFRQLARSRGYENVRYWPEEPLRGFDGTPNQLRERLSGLFHGGESPYHHAGAVTMLVRPPRTSRFRCQLVVAWCSLVRREKFALYLLRLV